MIDLLKYISENQGLFLSFSLGFMSAFFIMLIMSMVGIGDDL